MDRQVYIILRMDKYDIIADKNKFQKMLADNSDSDYEMTDELDRDNHDIIVLGDDSDNDDTIIDDNLSDKKPIKFDADELSDSDVEENIEVIDI